MQHDLVLEGRAVTSRGMEELQIGVDAGKIASVRKQGLKGERRIDCGGCLIMPGFIDVHAHLREPGWEAKEDFSTGTAAAVHGGVTTVFDMPNNPVPAVDLPTIREKIRLASVRAHVDVMFFAGVREDSLDEIPKVRESVIGYKIYLAKTTGDLMLDPGLLPRALDSASRTGRPVSIHCEDQELIDSKSAGLLGDTRPDAHADARPPEAEVRSVGRVLSGESTAAINVCHLSTAGALKLVSLSKGRGERRACEATLHHLYFTRKDMLSNRLLRTNPPLRSESDRAAVMDGLRSGAVDFLVTDHAPHTVEEKTVEGASGVPGLDNYANVVAWLLKEGVSPNTLVRACSGNQARFFGLNDRGSLQKGRRADFAVLDLKSEEKVSLRSVQSKCGWSPYAGRVFPGRARWTISLGRVLLDNFEMTL